MSAQRIEILPEVVQPQAFKDAVAACRDRDCMETPGYDPNGVTSHRHCQKCGQVHFVVDWDHGWSVHRPVFADDVVSEDGIWVWCRSCADSI